MLRTQVARFYTAAAFIRHLLWVLPVLRVQ
jgi:hypothetical protein